MVLLLLVGNYVPLHTVHIQLLPPYHKLSAKSIVDFGISFGYAGAVTEIIDEFHLAAWRAFINAHASVIDCIEKELAEAGQLPLTSYDLLVALAEAPDQRLRMTDLARKVVVLSRSGVTRLADRLEAEGLLRRERTPEDRRGAYAVLTEKGRDALDRARPTYARGIVEHFSRFLGDAEVRTLTSALGRIDAAARRS
ncbi:MAG: MarR family transcriptional regulator [Chloroflexi bacterium]|nr:MarR family transcriptional regulator [Chloroflexota bacterium]